MPLIINGEQVSPDVLDNEFSQIKSQEQQKGDISCCERDGEFRSAANENLIVRVLLSQEARKTTEPVRKAEVNKAIRKLEKSHGGRDKFFEAFNLEPGDENRVRRDVESTLHIEKMLDRLCGPNGEPGDEELKAFYEKHLDRYMNAERIRASHLLGSSSKAAGKDLYETLREIRKRLLEGEDFDKLARQHSEKYDPNGKAESDDPDVPRGDGIDLGFFARGELVQEFELVAFSMKVDEISPVFASPFGLHLVKLTGRHPAAPKPFEEVSAAVRAEFLQERRQEQIRRCVDELRSKATIEQLPDEEEPAVPETPAKKRKPRRRKKK